VTSAADAAGHPDVDEISALAEGLLSSSRTAVIRTHLKSCTDCSDTYTSLEEIRELLGGLLPAEPMPDDIAERIDAALASETLSAASAQMAIAEAASSEAGLPSPSSASGSVFRHDPDDPDDSEDLENDSSDGSQTSEHRTGSGTRTRVSRETSSAGPSGAPRNRPAGNPRGSTGPGRADRVRSGNRRKTITLGAVFTAVVIGVGTILLQIMTGDSSGHSSATPPGSSHTGEAFSSQNLEGQVSTLLKSHPKPAATDTAPSTTTSKPSLEMGSPGATADPTGHPRTATPLKRPEKAVNVPDCVRHGIGRSEEPIAAERGTYEGSDAYLVVLPDAADQSKVSAYVVDASCAQKPLPPPGKVLLNRSYPRR
jgi:hypothetical protein